jgi:nicotinamide/nicotinate riboside kinase
VQDWDAAPGAIDWPRLVSFLRHVKDTGEIPPDHRSHDHLNEQKDVPVPNTVTDRWKEMFDSVRVERAAHGERIIWGLVDGFLLYWNKVTCILECDNLRRLIFMLHKKDVIDELDVRLFLRTPHDVLKQRRHERHGYHTAGERRPIELVY